MKFTTSIKRGLLKAFYFLPQAKSLQNLEYDFKHLKQRTQKIVEEGFKMIKANSRTSITSSLTKNFRVLQVLFKYTWTLVHLGPSVNRPTKVLKRTFVGSESNFRTYAKKKERKKETKTINTTILSTWSNEHKRLSRRALRWSKQIPVLRLLHLLPKILGYFKCYSSTLEL